jgi:hypothetical protein
MKNNMLPHSTFRLIIVPFVILILNCSVAKAQIKFNSEKVKQIYALVPESVKAEIGLKSKAGAGLNLMTTSISGEKRIIAYRFNKYNELDHLGLSVISENNAVSDVREVFDYIERAFLVSVLLKEKYLLTKEVAENKIEVLYNGGLLKQQNSLSVLPKISVGTTTPLTIKIDPDFFRFQWKLEDSNTLDIKVPNDFMLISGKTKDELEAQLLRDLKTCHISNVEKIRPQMSQLKLYSQGIYQFPGEIYSTTPELSSSKYYFADDSIYPVFNNRYYKESIRNLFLNLVPTSQVLNVTQKLYGGKDEKLNLNVNYFLSNFSKGYKVYFGWQSSEKENLKASIFISSLVYNFNHLLVVTPNTRSIFKKNGEIEGYFFAYIPKSDAK